MRRTKLGRLRDGRISGELARRLLDAMVRHTGQLVSPDTLRDDIWGEVAPKSWRSMLPAVAQALNAKIGGDVVVRVGTRCRLEGFRLVPSLLPESNLTRVRTKPVKKWIWTTAEDTVIREQAGILTMSQLVAAVNVVEGRQRKPSAVEGRLYVLGCSKRIRAYSANSLAPVLGVSNDKITRWIEAGLLVATRTEPDGWQPGSRRWQWWVIQPAAVEAFIRACPWEIDWRAMQPGHPLMMLAQTIQRRDPYLTLGQAVRRVGMSDQWLLKRLHGGEVPGARRVTPHQANADPDRATWRIPLSSIDALPRGRRGRRWLPSEPRITVIDRAEAQARVVVAV